MYTKELLEKARRIYLSGNHNLVICKGEDVFSSDQRGIAPLVALIDENRDLSGAAAADKIVGRAAALLYVLMGVSAVYGENMSRGGAEVLQANGIHCSYTNICDMIINRSGDGMCPMEETVSSTSSPKEALALIKAKIKKLKEEKAK